VYQEMRRLANMKKGGTIPDVGTGAGLPDGL
jgi:hypothetical protein